MAAPIIKLNILWMQERQLITNPWQWNDVTGGNDHFISPVNLLFVILNEMHDIFLCFFHWLENSSEFITRILNDFFAFVLYRNTAYQYVSRSHLSDTYLPHIDAIYLTQLILLYCDSRKVPPVNLSNGVLATTTPDDFERVSSGCSNPHRPVSANSIWHPVCQLTTLCSKLSGTLWCIATATRLLHTPNLLAASTRMLV